MKRSLLTILFLYGASTMLMAQPGNDKADIEREKKALQAELRDIQEMYDKVKGQTKQSLGQLNMVKRKISLQERVINSSNREIKLIEDDMYRSNLEIYRLQKQLDTLKTQYARTVVYAYKNRSSFDYVNFIFSATSFNDALRRVSYLKSYRAYREKQVSTIQETQALITKRQEQQLARKQEKSQALQGLTKERAELANQKKEKDAVVSKLQSEGNNLKKEIAQKKKRDRDLQNALNAIVRREIEAATRKEKERVAAEKKEADRIAAERKKNELASNNNNAATTPVVKPTKTVEAPAKKPASYLEMNASDVALGADFANNRGKLPWPVDKSVVLIPFGRYEVEGFKGIVDDNPGITIGTNTGASVKSVFDGEVIGIHNYGDAAAVVIRHGKYFTTYSNLSSVSVSKGARVKTGQAIGKAGEADDGSGGQVNFILMIENKNINPAPWLRR